jgi:predicted RND superfamily exporter protein
MSNRFGRLAAWAVRRPGTVIAVTALVTAVGALAALRLDSEAATDTLVDRDSETFAATQRFDEQFGDDPVVILVRGQLEDLLLTDNLGRLLQLEGCLAGQVAPGAEALNETCQKIADLDPTQVVFGPATFLNQSAVGLEQQLSGQSQAAIEQARTAAAAAARRAKRQGLSEEEQIAAARAAGQGVLGQFQQQILELAVQTGQTGPPRIDDPRFVSSIVFDTRFAGGVPKARFSDFFPNPEAALIAVRLRPELSEAQRAAAIGLFRDAVAHDDFRLRAGGGEDPSYVVSGVPVVVEGLTKELEQEIFILLGVALAVMAVTLVIVFGPPLRLLPLAVALVATALAFGGLAAFGGSLTMASLAVLPVLIGLAVDYAIQFQARFREAVARRPAQRGAAAAEAAGRGGPVIATAGLATAAGFVVLLLSPIPLVRVFGLLLVLGIAIAFAVALTAGFAALALRGAPRPKRAGARRLGRVGRAAVRLAAARERAAERLGRVGKSALATSIGAPGRVLVIALVLAVAGWIAGTRTEVASDIRALVPGDLPALQDVDALEQETGVSGEISVVVDAPDVTDPALIEWMGEFKQRVLVRHGFGGEFPSCDAADLCPGLSLPDIFGEGELTHGRVDALLGIAPPYFVRGLLAPSSEPGAIGEDTPGLTHVRLKIPVMPLDEQKRLIDDIRAQIDPPGTDNGPPEGVEATVAGLPALAADANSQLSGSRYWLTLAGLLAVAAVLLSVYRSPGRALVPLIPIVLATGWSAMVIAAMDIPLNPMSATLGALVIAIATEFSVILSARYHEERASGHTVGEALRRTYSRTGAAVLASGTTAIVGFAVLIATEITMLRDFGLVTVVDLAVALLGVMLVLPAALVWAEGGFEPLAEPAARIGRRLGGLVPARLRPGDR